MPDMMKHNRSQETSKSPANSLAARLEKLTTFLAGIRQFMKAYATLRQKLYTRSSEHIFDQGDRVVVSRVATHLDIRDRVSMQAGRLSQVPNRPIQGSTRHPNLCTCHRHETVPMSHVTTSQPSPCRRINGNPVNFKSSEPTTARRAQERNSRQFLGGSGAHVILSADEAALNGRRHEQNVQMKSQKRLVVLRKDTRQTLAHAAKSLMAQAPRLRSGGWKSSPTSHRQRQTAAKLITFMTGIRRLINANAVLWQKLYARFSEHTFDQRKRVLGSRVATHLDS